MMDDLSPLQALIHKHCDTLQREMSDVVAAFEAWEREPSNAQFSRDAARSAVHKIKGSSGTIGFSDISETAQKIETRLKLSDPDDLLAMRDELLDEYSSLRTLIAQISPQQSSLYHVHLQG